MVIKKKFKISFISIVLTIGICFPLSLSGQENDGIRSHEKFFLRFLGGAGPGSFVIDYSGSDMSFKAMGGVFHFQIGSEISDNLVLFADLGGFTLSEPNIEWQGSTSTVKNTDISSMGFGVGLSYYFMPADIYLSSSLLMSQVNLENSNVKAESEMGPGIFLCIGKEWWVGKKWGLGVAGFFEAALVKDQKDAQGYQPDINSQIFGLAFTATMY